VICRHQQQKRGKLKNLKIEEVNENTPNLVGVLIERLEMSSEVVEDLVEVFKIIDNNYDVPTISMCNFSFRETKPTLRGYSAKKNLA